MHNDDEKGLDFGYSKNDNIGLSKLWPCVSVTHNYWTNNSQYGSVVYISVVWS